LRKKIDIVPGLQRVFYTAINRGFFKMGELFNFF